MARPNDLGDFTALLRSLVERGFWGTLRIQLQEGAILRCVLEESAKHPRQLMGNGNTVEDQHDDSPRQ
jgi:hypothetical protein